MMEALRWALTIATVALLVRAYLGLRLMLARPPTDWRGSVPCGDRSLKARTILRLRTVTPDRDSILCRVLGHQLACCPNHATFVYEPGTDDLMGMCCERCGGLFQ